MTEDFPIAPLVELDDWTALPLVPMAATLADGQEFGRLIAWLHSLSARQSVTYVPLRRHSGI